MTDTGGSFGRAPKPQFVGAGGTPGGVGEFFLGLLLAAVGLYLLFNQVEVHTSFWRFGGYSPGFGVSLLPLLFGVGILFFNGGSTMGWLLTVGGLLFIILGILLHMDIRFQRTSLWNTLLMLGLIAAGLGLLFRSLRPHRGQRLPQ